MWRRQSDNRDLITGLVTFLSSSDKQFLQCRKLPARQLPARWKPCPLALTRHLLFTNWPDTRVGHGTCPYVSKCPCNYELRIAAQYGPCQRSLAGRLDLEAAITTQLNAACALTKAVSDVMHCWSIMYLGMPAQRSPLINNACAMGPSCVSSKCLAAICSRCYCSRFLMQGLPPFALSLQPYTDEAE